MPRESRTIRAVVGEAASWTTTDHLIAVLVDLTAGGNWQRSGGKGTRPKPLQRPGQKPSTDERRYGTPRPIDEVKALLSIVRDD